MEKELLVFGANSPLAKGVVEVLKEYFNKIYLFASKHEIQNESKIECITIQDLAVETNVIDAFSFVHPSREKEYFLFSAVGGFAGGKNIWEWSEEEFHEQFNKNVKVNFLLAKHFANLIMESAGGSICFTSAYTGLNPEAKKGTYGSAKAALIHLCQTLSIEGKEINLTSNIIAPYIIDTPENRKWMPDSDYSTWYSPEEIGQHVLNLFKNYKFVTGNVLVLKEKLS